MYGKHDLNTYAKDISIYMANPFEADSSNSRRATLPCVLGPKYNATSYILENHLNFTTLPSVETKLEAVNSSLCFQFLDSDYSWIN